MPISVEHLTRAYGDFTAVDDLSFEVGPGEIVGLIGPNGAGKTTTLRSLAGILRPNSGTVRIDGHDIVEDALEAKRRLAFMPDEPHLFEYLTVDEHLRLVARLYGVDDFDRRARALVSELELTGKEKSLPGELSRGMRQKVVIASGLVRNPSVLLFDEPLTGLDPIGIRRMRETIVARGRAGASILVSSHLQYQESDPRPAATPSRAQVPHRRDCGRGVFLLHDLCADVGKAREHVTAGRPLGAAERAAGGDRRVGAGARGDCPDDHDGGGVAVSEGQQLSRIHRARDPVSVYGARDAAPTADASPDAVAASAVVRGDRAGAAVSVGVARVAREVRHLDLDHSDDDEGALHRHHARTHEPDASRSGREAAAMGRPGVDARCGR